MTPAGAWGSKCKIVRKTPRHLSVTQTVTQLDGLVYSTVRRNRELAGRVAMVAYFMRRACSEENIAHDTNGNNQNCSSIRETRNAGHMIAAHNAKLCALDHLCLSADAHTGLPHGPTNDEQKY